MATFEGEEVNPGNWLKAADLDYGSRVVQIESAGFEEVGEEKERKLVLQFVNEPKGLVLNKTNTDMIEAILGEPKVEKWLGMAIELYVDKVPFRGRIYDAIRVRTVRDAAPVAQEEPVVPA